MMPSEPAHTHHAAARAKEARQRRRPPSKLWLKFALLAFSVASALPLGELLVRQVAPQQLYRFPQGLFETHEARDYRMTPNFKGVMATTEFRADVQTNSLGLRESKEYGAKRDDTMRILALGDSFTMGVGVEAEQTFVKVLESQLNSLSPGTAVNSTSGASHTDRPLRFEVINAGVPGYNLIQDRLYLEAEGRQLDPDLVLLNIYVGNDVLETYKPASITVRDGYMVSSTQMSSLLPDRMRRWLQLRSHLYNLLWPVQRAVRDPRYKEWLERSLSDQAAIYVANPDAEVSAMWEATRRELTQLKDFAQSEGFALAVVVIPTPEQISQQRWRQSLPAAASTSTAGASSAYQRDYPNRRIRSMCAELALPTLDLFPILADRPTATANYFPVDGHWTPVGNAVAADALLRFLKAEALF